MQHSENHPVSLGNVPSSSFNAWRHNRLLSYWPTYHHTIVMQSLMADLTRIAQCLSIPWKSSSDSPALSRPASMPVKRRTIDAAATSELILHSVVPHRLAFTVNAHCFSFLF